MLELKASCLSLMEVDHLSKVVNLGKSGSGALCGVIGLKFSKIHLALIIFEIWIGKGQYLYL